MTKLTINHPVIRARVGCRLISTHPDIQLLFQHDKHISSLLNTPNHVDIYDQNNTLSTEVKG